MQREAYLASEDMDKSLDGVEALIKKHEDFDKSLVAQVPSETRRNYSRCIGSYL